MPALRALKTDEEIAAIPLDQPILVELPGGVIDVDEEGGIVADKSTGKTKEPEAVDGAKVLQEQLEASHRAHEAERARADKAERDATDARKLAAEAGKRTAALEGDVITGGLAAAQAEVVSAKQALQTAGEAGDYKAMADAQERIARAAGKILNFEAGAAEIAERPKVEARQEQVRQAPLDPIAAIDSNPNLLPAERQWLKDHPDAVIDMKRNNELGVAYERAVKQGLTRGTPAYFTYLNEFMGYEKPANDADNSRETNVSAPPSRQERGGDGRPSANRITLSPEQREIAKSMGVTDIEYARQVQAFEVARKVEPDKYR